MKKTKKERGIVRQLALGANAEEVRRFEVIKAFYGRRSDSDMIRYFINREIEKILPGITPNGVEVEA